MLWWSGAGDWVDVMEVKTKKPLWPVLPVIISLLLTVCAAAWAIVQPVIGTYALLACLPLVGLGWWFALAVDGGDEA